MVEWAKRGEALGAGEILLMSVDNEGLQRGMDLELIEAVTKAVRRIFFPITAAPYTSWWVPRGSPHSTSLSPS